MVYIPRTVGHTIQCSAFVCSGRLSPGRQRHNEENNHSLVGSRPDLINHDTSSLPDAPASCRADDQCARGGTNCAAERQKLDAGVARDRDFDWGESRKKLHAIKRYLSNTASPLNSFRSLAITNGSSVQVYSSRTQRKPRLFSPLSGVAWLRAATR